MSAHFHHSNPSRDVEISWEEIAEVFAFHKDVAPTPLIRSNHFGESGPELYLKDESSRMNSCSFKILGVSYAVNRLMDEGKLRTGDTIASMTDGNHGEALALVAKQQGLESIVLVPKNVPAVRVQRLREMGAQVEIVCGTYDDCIDELRKRACEMNWVVISDTSWKGYEQVPRDIMRGYSVIFAEALRDLVEPPTHVFLQAGVGGLLASGAAFMSLSSPDTRIVCVEPIDAGCIIENLREGRVVETLRQCDGATNSNMQGLNCGLPSVVAWPIIRGLVDDCIAIGDEWAHVAMRTLSHEGLSVSESGAAGYAGVLAAMEQNKFGVTADSRVLIILTEGVTDRVSWENVVKQKMSWERLLSVCEKYCNWGGYRFNIDDLNSEDEEVVNSLEGAMPVILEMGKKLCSLWENKKDCTKNEIIIEFNMCQRFLQRQAVYETLACTCAELDLHGKEALDAYSPSDCKFEDMTEPLDVIAQRLFNHKHRMETDKEFHDEWGRREKRKAEASFIVDFGLSYGLSDVADITSQTMLSDFEERVTEYKKAKRQRARSHNFISHCSNHTWGKEAAVIATIGVLVGISVGISAVGSRYL